MENLHSRDGIRKRLEKFDDEMQNKINNEVEKRVQEALQWEFRADIERKERLKQQLRNDGFVFAEKTKHISDARDRKKSDDAMKFLFDMEREKEKERLEEVERRRALQTMLNCEEARLMFSKQQDKLIRSDQMWQIKQKLKESSKKAEDDKNYYEMVVKNVEDAMKAQEAERKKFWKSQVEAKTAYLQQMEWINQRKQIETREKEKDKLQIQMLVQSNQQLDEQERIERKKRSEVLGAEMKNFMEEEKKRREMRRKEEKSMHDQIAIFDESTKEGVKGAVVMEQLESFKECLDDLREKRKIEESIFDERLKALMDDIDMKKDLENQKIQAAKLELMQSVQRGRRDQVEKKLLAQRLESHREAKDHQEVLMSVKNHQYAVSKAQDQEKARKQLYAEQLRQQIREREQKKIREQEELKKEAQQVEIEHIRRKQELEDLVLNASKLQNHPLRGIAAATFFIPRIKYPNIQ